MEAQQGGSAPIIITKIVSLVRSTYYITGKTKQKQLFET